MEKLKINGYLIEVDYPAELEPYMDRLERVRIRGEKIQACSPFRNEKHPSWAVNLDNGSWVDSGADEEENRKGSFITLLSFFRGESYEETATYLLDKYSHILDDADSLKLELKLELKPQENGALNKEEYEGIIDKTSEYLLNRGICAETQIQFQTGVGKGSKSVALPWHDKDGRIINIKYRSVLNKEFWFSKGGQPIKNHVYGLFAVRDLKALEVWAVESEIDALYLWTHNIPAIAFGGASINDKQKALLLNSGIETLVIATDNDVVGQRFANVLINEFTGYMKLKKIKFPVGVKDINEMDEKVLNWCSCHLQDIFPSWGFL
ncbi:toprim domain-containing protein [Clostridium perfringens]|nr:toprim domain-containing protein [Clostridium perfringens]